MDKIDCKIIDALLENGRRPTQDIADRVGLSPSATRDRLRRLERDGPIAGDTVVLDTAATGLRLQALVEVEMTPGTDPLAFEAGLRDTPAVVEALHATGDCDYIVRLQCRDTADLHQTLRGLKGDLGAAHTRTRVILEESVPARQRLP
jgi:Lrp/AsnC family leucine-responsive transcriptional regulator